MILYKKFLNLIKKNLSKILGITTVIKPRVNTKL